MCNYIIPLNDELVRQTRQSFADEAEMNNWLQRQVEALLIDYNARQRMDNARRAIEVMRRQSEQNGNARMTLDEINNEIRMARKARRQTV